MANERIKLNDTEINLLCLAAAELIPALQKEEKHVSSVKQLAFQYYDKDSDGIFEVQVTVTRAESEFIPMFTTEVLSIYGGK